MMTELRQPTSPVAPQDATWTWAFPWEFVSIESLREDGLERYTEMSEGLKINRYGRLLGNEPTSESWLCALRRHKEVNFSLLAMKEVGQRNLLHVYYRQGLSVRHRGWMKAANLVRVQGVKPKKCPGSAVRCAVGEDYVGGRTVCPEGRHCPWDRETFEAQVSLAIRSLWRAHRGRYQQDS